jgi:HEPN domain-containing protein
LSEPAPKTISETFTKANRRKRDLARLFFETACDAMQKERHEIAVFALHQAVELTCTALLRTCLGYKPNTHSINKLFMLLENTPVRIDSIFPRTAAEDVAVFNILQRGYSDVRYKEEYSVTGDKVTMLIARVRQFQIAAFRLCQNQWNHPTSTP